MIVSGGNEIRVGAHRGMALLAERLAAAGLPVFRFDRRGIGDSTGANDGYTSSGPDIAAAVRAFRAQVPHLSTLIGRSEERRVGKECVSTCRSRWSAYHSKKKKNQDTKNTTDTEKNK